MSRAASTIGRALLATALLTFASSAVFAQSPKKIKFQMDFVPQGMYSGFFWAQSKGYYKAENLEVEMIDGKGSALTIEAVANGNIDIGEANSGVAALAIGQGREIVSVGMYIGRSTFGFFVPVDGPIKSIKDLAGKSLVMTPSAPEGVLLAAVMKQVNVDANTIQKIAVDGSQKLSTYARGQGDAMVTSIPFGDAIVQPQRKSNTLPWTSVGFVLPDYSFLVQRKTLESDPAMIAAFLRATYRGVAEAADKVDEAVNNYVKERPLLKFDVAKQQWVGFTTFFCSEGMDGKLLGYHSPQDWKIGLETLRDYSGLTGSLDAKRFYTNQFFEGANAVSKTKCGKGMYPAGQAAK
jgi:NitT/TauT family transport system substrate-binding protein